jgi:N-acetyl-anhydromuramyl-L-alanine amidase AmpD
MDDYPIRYDNSGSPDVPYDRFKAVLTEAGSPAAPEAHGMYSHLAAHRVHPSVFLAFFRHESGYGLLGICKEYDTRNPGNVRTPEVPSVGVTVVQTPRGQFAKFPDWRTGTGDWAARMAGPKYAGAGLITVRQVLPKYAPSSENDTERYIASVLSDIQRYVSPAPPSATTGGTMTPKPPMTTKPSPNKGGYATPHKPEAIVWHVTVGGAAGSLSWLTNPASNASANYLIDRTGKVYELVPPTESAWANGLLSKPDYANPVIKGWVDSGVNPNTRTVSIECERITSANEQPGGFTEPQRKALVGLSAWLCSSLGIKPDRQHIIGHRSVDSVTRLHCPGLSEGEWDAWVGEIAALVSPPAPAPSGMMEPVITERVVWGGKGRLVAQTVTVANTADGKYYERKVRYDATGMVLEEWREV